MEAENSMEGRPLGATCALVLLCAAAFLVRLLGLGHGLPHRTEPDVFVVAQVAMAEPGFLEGAREDDLELSREAYAAYPHLLADLLWLWPDGERTALKTRGEALERAGEGFLRARLLCALLGALLAPATYLLARSFLPRAPALFAAALVASSLLLVNFSQQARPHMVAATFATLALAACVRARSSPLPGPRRLAFLATVAAIGSLQSGVLCLLPLFFATGLAEHPRTHARRRWGRALLAAAAALGLAIVAFYPMLFTTRIDRALEESLVVRDHLSDPRAYDGSGFARLFADVADYDPVLLALGLLGSAILAVHALAARRAGPPAEAAAARGRRRDLAIVLSFAVPYLVIFGAYQASTARYAIPLLPLFAIAAAGGVHVLLARARGTQWLPWVALAAVAFPLGCSLRLAWLRHGPDSCLLAARWLEEHASPEQSIWLSPGLDLPLVRTEEALAADSPQALGALRQPWFRFQANLNPVPAGWRWPLRTVPFVRDGRVDEEFANLLRDDPRRAVESLDADYVLLAAFSDGARAPRSRRLEQGLQLAGAEIAETFAPYFDDRGAPRPLRHQDSGRGATSFLEGVLRASIDGPVIQIWRLERDAGK